MPDSVVTMISRAAGSIVDTSSLAELSSHKWAFFESFGVEVLEVVNLAKSKVQQTSKRKRYKNEGSTQDSLVDEGLNSAILSQQNSRRRGLGSPQTSGQVMQNEGSSSDPIAQRGSQCKRRRIK